MKIAVCYSGQLRMGREAFENQLAFFGDLLPHIDFFVHTWDINTNKRYYGFKQRITPTVFEEYFDLLKPKKTKIESFDSFEANRKNKLVPLYYSWQQSVILKQEYEKENNIRYDVAVKLRPDLILATGRNLEMHIKDVIDHHIFMAENIPLGERWRECTFNDDVMYIATNDIMDFAVNYQDYSNPDELLLPFLDRHCIGIKATHFRLRENDRGYSIYRDECQQFNVLTQFTECSACDREFFNPESPRHIPYRS